MCQHSVHNSEQTTTPNHSQHDTQPGSYFQAPVVVANNVTGARSSSRGVGAVPRFVSEERGTVGLARAVVAAKAPETQVQAVVNEEVAPELLE